MTPRIERRRQSLRRLAPLVLAAAAMLPVAAATPGTARAIGPTLAQLVGQKLIVRMDGTTPSADLLGRIRRGEVGGVILFGANITTKAALVSLTHELHQAAVAGGEPRLLIAVDQEGVAIKRIPWAPPVLSPPAIGRLDSTSVARAQGQATGTALKALGIDIDLAPVADVPASTGSLLYRQGRTWSFSATQTTLLSNAFSVGLETAGVAPAMKHFPGLGFATLNTDLSVVSIRASAAALSPGLLPYRTAIGQGLPLVMLSNATYTAWDPAAAAGWSPAIGTTLLRGTLGFRGVTITDSLDGTAAARGYPTSHLAYRAAKAGTDLLLVAGSEASTRGDYAVLLAAARAGQLSTTSLRASYDRILALKARW